MDGDVVGTVGQGWVILLRIGPQDDEAAAVRLVDKVVLLRVFEDEVGTMNLSALDVGAEVLIVSQFTT